MSRIYVVMYFMSCLSAPSRMGENIYPCALSTSGAWWHTDLGFERLQAEHRLKTSPLDSIFHSESTQSCTHVAKSFIVARPGWFSSQKRPCLAKIPVHHLSLPRSPVTRARCNALMFLCHSWHVTMSFWSLLGMLGISVWRIINIRVRYYLCLVTLLLWIWRKNEIRMI